MLLKYHDILLDKSIPLDYFSEFDEFIFVNDMLLRNGLHYPDLPCGKLKIVGNDKIVYKNYNTCNLAFLSYVFFENTFGFKELVQSHRGKQAIGHSMTYNPNKTVIELRQEILKRAEILYMLALNDDTIINSNEPKPNIFWIGIILHLIQDSYSIVHTVRVYNDDSNDYELPIDEIPVKEKEETILTFKILKKLRNFVDMQINKGSLLKKTELIAILLENIESEMEKKIINCNPKDLFRMYKLITYYKLKEKKIIDLFNGEHNLPSSANLNKNKSIYEHYPYIKTFQYIPFQKKCGLTYHAINDTAKKNSSFEPFIIDNCKFILELYKNHLYDQSKPLNDKISEFIDYIAVNVFPILDKYKDNKSAYDIDCLKTGGRKIRKFKQY